MANGRGILFVLSVAAFLFLPRFAYGQGTEPEWLDDRWREANYPRNVWYVGFAQERVGNLSTADAVKRVERDSQNKLVESITLRVTATSRTETMSVGGGSGSESVDRNYGRLVQATASAEISEAETFTHHDAANDMVYAFTVVRRTDLASYYANRIDAGLTEAERILELAREMERLDRNREAFDRSEESQRHTVLLDHYRDLLVVIDPENGVERSQGNRLNKLLANIAALQGELQGKGLVPGGDVMIDQRDGRKYRTIEIGNQVWMAENLNFTTANSWCYGNNDDDCETYGRLYDWNAARVACPGGWRLPTRRDWDELISHGGGWRVAGRKLKSEADWNGTNDFGFSALPAGGRSCAGVGFGLRGENTFWWGSTETTRGSGEAFCWGLDAGESYIAEGRNRKTCGFSVRCIQEDHE